MKHLHSGNNVGLLLNHPHYESPHSSPPRLQSPPVHLRIPPPSGHKLVQFGRSVGLIIPGVPISWLTERRLSMDATVLGGLQVEVIGRSGGHGVVVNARGRYLGQWSRSGLLRRHYSGCLMGQLGYEEAPWKLECDRVGGTWMRIDHHFVQTTVISTPIKEKETRNK